MFNTFEQGHDEFLEPKWNKIVAQDWCGNDIYEGDCGYHKAPNGDIVHEDDFPEWVATYFTEKEF